MTESSQNNKMNGPPAIRQAGYTSQEEDEMGYIESMSQPYMEETKGKQLPLASYHPPGAVGGTQSNYRTAQPKNTNPVMKSGTGKVTGLNKLNG